MQEILNEFGVSEIWNWVNFESSNTKAFGRMKIDIELNIQNNFFNLYPDCKPLGIHVKLGVSCISSKNL
jgi:hypothetical protein